MRRTKSLQILNLILWLHEISLILFRGKECIFRWKWHSYLEQTVIHCTIFSYYFSCVRVFHSLSLSCPIVGLACGSFFFQKGRCVIYLKFQCASVNSFSFPFFFFFSLGFCHQNTMYQMGIISAWNPGYKDLMSRAKLRCCQFSDSW
jgi:hypothetical protein